MPYLTNEEWEGHLAEPIINQLTSLVDEAKSAVKNDSSNGIKIGKRLLKDTNPLLKELKSAISNDIRYQMTADKVGNTVLQCAINCYNDSDDKQVAHDALDLAKKAKSVVVGKMAKDRCDENIAILQKAVDHLPPEEVELESMMLLLILANAASPDNITISEAESILEDAAPQLKSMKSKLGARNQYYLEQSTLCVTIAMTALYNEIKASHSSSSLSTILRSSWQLIQKIDEFDMTDEFRERYQKERSTLQGLCSQRGAVTPRSSSYPSLDSNESGSDDEDYDPQTSNLISKLKDAYQEDESGLWWLFRVDIITNCRWFIM